MSRLDEYRDGNEDKGRLLVSCPDQPGIVSAVSAFLFEHGANIIESNQYTTDPEGGRFFLRIEFDCAGIREKNHHFRQRLPLLRKNST